MEKVYTISVFVDDQLKYTEFFRSSNEKEVNQYIEYTEQCIRELYLKTNEIIKSTRKVHEVQELTTENIKKKEELLKEISKNRCEKIELIRQVNILHSN
jgi:Ser-tRNA(Ala) deacylase AlaX